MTAAARANTLRSTAVLLQRAIRRRPASLPFVLSLSKRRPSSSSWRPLALVALRLLSLCLATPLAAALPVQRVVVVHAYPHDRGAFTEGLFFRDGALFESTGLEGRSSLRIVRLADGKAFARRDLPPAVFGEGIVDWGSRLIALEWQSGRGTIWSLPGLRKVGAFRYRPEGWGLTRDARRLIMSDGTARLRFLDPRTLAETGGVEVRAEGRPVRYLNELEYIDGEVWANVWQTDLIARIDPASGRVKGWIDISGLLPDHLRVPGETDVANGIAWDAKRRRVFVTGKNWPQLYEVRLLPPETR